MSHNKICNVGRRIRNLWLKFVDPRRVSELAGGGVVFNNLKKKGFLNGLEAIGSFDLIWCLGVLCHNVEQLRLLKRLFDPSNVGGGCNGKCYYEE